MTASRMAAMARPRSRASSGPVRSPRRGSEGFADLAGHVKQGRQPALLLRGRQRRDRRVAFISGETGQEAGAGITPEPAPGFPGRGLR